MNCLEYHFIAIFCSYQINSVISSVMFFKMSGCYITTSKILDSLSDHYIYMQTGEVFTSVLIINCFLWQLFIFCLKPFIRLPYLYLTVLCIDVQPNCLYVCRETRKGKLHQWVGGGWVIGGGNPLSSEALILISGYLHFWTREWHHSWVGAFKEKQDLLWFLVR